MIRAAIASSSAGASRRLLMIVSFNSLRPNNSLYFPRGAMPLSPALCIKRTNNIADLSRHVNHNRAMAQSIVIHGLIKKRAEIAGAHKVAVKAADVIRDDLAAIDRALLLCGYTDDPNGIAPRGKYKQMFGRNELKLTIIRMLREASADDLAIAAQIINVKGWDADDSALSADVLKRVRHAIQRAQKDGHVVRTLGRMGVCGGFQISGFEPLKTAMPTNLSMGIM